MKGIKFFILGVCVFSLSLPAYSMGRDCPKLEGTYLCSEGAYKFKMSRQAVIPNLIFQIDFIACPRGERPLELLLSSETYYINGKPYLVPVEGSTESNLVRSHCESQTLVVESVPQLSPNSIPKEHRLFLRKSGELVLQEGASQHGEFVIQDSEVCLPDTGGTKPEVEMRTFKSDEE